MPILLWNQYVAMNINGLWIPNWWCLPLDFWSSIISVDLILLISAAIYDATLNRFS